MAKSATTPKKPLDRNRNAIVLMTVSLPAGYRIEFCRSKRGGVYQRHWHRLLSPNGEIINAQENVVNLSDASDPILKFCVAMGIPTTSDRGDVQADVQADAPATDAPATDVQSASDNQAAG